MRYFIYTPLGYLFLHLLLVGFLLGSSFSYRALRRKGAVSMRHLLMHLQLGYAARWEMQTLGWWGLVFYSLVVTSCFLSVLPLPAPGTMRWIGSGWLGSFLLLSHHRWARWSGTYHWLILYGLLGYTLPLVQLTLLFQTGGSLWLQSTVLVTLLLLFYLIPWRASLFLYASAGFTVLCRELPLWVEIPSWKEMKHPAWLTLEAAVVAGTVAGALLVVVFERKRRQQEREAFLERTARGTTNIGSNIVGVGKSYASIVGMAFDNMQVEADEEEGKCFLSSDLKTYETLQKYLHKLEEGHDLAQKSLRSFVMPLRRTLRETEFEKLEIKPLLQEVLQEYAFRNATAIKLLSFQGEGFAFSGSDMNIKEALLALLHNAHYFGGEGVGVDIACTERKVSITSEGAWIEPSQRISLFAPGYTTLPNGLGLGLHYVGRVMLSCGGTAWYEPSVTSTGKPANSFLLSFPPLQSAGESR